MMPFTFARRSVWQVPHVWAKTSFVGCPCAASCPDRNGAVLVSAVVAAAEARVVGLLPPAGPPRAMAAADHDDERDRERVPADGAPQSGDRAGAVAARQRGGPLGRLARAGGAVRPDGGRCGARSALGRDVRLRLATRRKRSPGGRGARVPGVSACPPRAPRRPPVARDLRHVRDDDRPARVPGARSLRTGGADPARGRVDRRGRATSTSRTSTARARGARFYSGDLSPRAGPAQRPAPRSDRHRVPAAHRAPRTRSAAGSPWSSSSPPSPRWRFVLAAALARRIVPEPWATGAALVAAFSPPALIASTTIAPGRGRGDGDRRRRAARTPHPRAPAAAVGVSGCAVLVGRAGHGSGRSSRRRRAIVALATARLAAAPPARARGARRARGRESSRSSSTSPSTTASTAGRSPTRCWRIPDRRGRAASVDHLARAPRAARPVDRRRRRAAALGAVRRAELRRAGGSSCARAASGFAIALSDQVDRRGHRRLLRRDLRRGQSRSRRSSPPRSPARGSRATSSCASSRPAPRSRGGRCGASRAPAACSRCWTGRGRGGGWSSRRGSTAGTGLAPPHGRLPWGGVERVLPPLR